MTSAHLRVTGQVRLLMHRARGVGNTTAMLDAAARATDPVTILVHAEPYAQELRKQLRGRGAGAHVRVLSAQAELERHLRGNHPEQPVLIDLPVLELVAAEATRAESQCKHLAHQLAVANAMVARAERQLANFKAAIATARERRKVRGLLRRLDQSLNS